MNIRAICVLYVVWTRLDEDGDRPAGRRQMNKRRMSWKNIPDFLTLSVERYCTFTRYPLSKRSCPTRPQRAVESAARQAFKDNVRGNTTAASQRIKNIKSFRPVDLDLGKKSRLHRVRDWQNGRNFVFQSMATNRCERPTLRDVIVVPTSDNRFSFNVSRSLAISH